MSEFPRDLIIIGASTRAAAFSALRAGLQPWCVDLFADLDLQGRCPVQQLEGKYPQDFATVIESDPAGPWMYTGGLENWPALIGAWANRRQLWGVRKECLEWARDLVRIAQMLREEGLPTPDTLARAPFPGRRRWLMKPRRGAGGTGIREWTNDEDIDCDSVYWQEYIVGQAAAAIYARVKGRVSFLGLTRQLVGVPWLHARLFHYCGSIGPLRPPPALRDELINIGETVGSRCNLQGLFGVDGVLSERHFWPVEINPRYTASIEVLEYATGIQALAWHRRAFDPDAPDPCKTADPARFVGKAILFAPADLTFPAAGPWLAELRSPSLLTMAPNFADIPAPGEFIPKGRPILTFFVHTAQLIACEDALRTRAEELLRHLYWEGLPPISARPRA